jgi:peptidase YpeB-like protein
MRLASKTLLVALGVAFLIAGFPSPRTGTTTTSGGRHLTRASASQQPSARDQRPTDGNESPADQEGGDDTPLTGAAAEQAKAAAQAAVPGATVRQVERETNDEDTPASAFEVELTRPDGTTVEVELDTDHKVVGTDREERGPDDD